MRGVFVTGHRHRGRQDRRRRRDRPRPSAAGAPGRRLQARGHRPRRAGGEEPDHELLRLAAGCEQSDDEIAPYRYGPPSPPTSRAELAGEPIDPDRLRAAAARRSRRAPSCSSARASAGCSSRSPATTWSATSRASSALPVVIAASPGLGTINHTLLTIEAARAAGLDVDRRGPDPLARGADRRRGVQPRDDRSPGLGGSEDAAAAGPDQARELAGALTIMGDSGNSPTECNPFWTVGSWARGRSPAAPNGPPRRVVAVLVRAYCDP